MSHIYNIGLRKILLFTIKRHIVTYGPSLGHTHLSDIPHNSMVGIADEINDKWMTLYFSNYVVYNKY